MLVIAIAAFTMMFASAAHAVKPKPPYEQFAGCPSKAEAASVSSCLRAVVKSGHFQMGTKDVPITDPIVITGGVDEELGNFKFNAEGGMKPSKQKVPGGVVGLTGLTWLLEILGSEALTLYAETQAVGLPIFEGVNNITLPIRVHLINGTLGNNCYVGSPTNPITLHLTTGTTSPPPPNVPISGKLGVVTFDPTTEILKITGTKYVDNSFSAPGASGCVLTLFGFIPISINGLVNTQSGLPSASGKNETIQNTDTEVAEVGLVYP